MKSWLTKLRISAAMDSGKPLPESVRQKIAGDPELQNFVRRADVLGRALRHPAPAQIPSLHSSIMRALRASGRGPRRRAWWAGWWIPSSALAALALAGVLPALHHRAPAAVASLEAPARVLEMGEAMPAAMPSVLMAPLSNEWARVELDLRNTAQVLLASVP